MYKQIQNNINFLILCLIVCSICFIQADSGCTDSEAYNCEGSINGEYVNDIGGTIYDYSCDGNEEHAGPEDCTLDEICEGYYDPEATVDDGSCRYFQAPHGDDVDLDVIGTGITGDWSAFTPPGNAVLESYHIQRCIETCTWIPGFTLGDTNTETSFIDEFDYESGVEIKYAIAVKYSNNPYWGWAIGASYITPCPLLGDINGDGGYNVLDIVTLANCVLNQNCNDIEFACASDVNNDGNYNVLDIVTLANCVLNQNCNERVDNATESKLIMKGNIVLIEADGFIGGVQMTLQHGDDFSIEMTDRALFADYLTIGNKTRLLVITPEIDKLFSYSGDFEIAEIIVANSHAEVSVSLPLVTNFSVSDAYPNQFNPTTTMELTMLVSDNIHVEVYNLRGQSVAILTNGYKNAGTYTLTWDATDAVSGMYFLKAQTDVFTTTQKLMLVK